jgi:hypothetical protein
MGKWVSNATAKSIPCFEHSALARINTIQSISEGAAFVQVSSLSQLLVDFVELPMGATAEEGRRYNTCLLKMPVLVNYWHSQVCASTTLTPSPHTTTHAPCSNL